MKFLIWFLALFAAAVALTLATHNPGYVQLVYPPYRVGVSLSLFVISLLGMFVLGYLLVRLLISAVNLPAYVRAFREDRAQSKGRTAMMESLTAFFEGRYSAAENAAVRAMELGEKSGLNPIVAARSAHELREFDKRDAYLADAEKKKVGESTMRLMAKTEFQLDQKQPQSALGSLKELNEAGGKRKHVGALTLELKAQQLAGNWDAVLDVATQLEKRNAIDSTLSIQLRQRAWLEKLRTDAHTPAALRDLWKSIPSEFKQRPKIAAAAAHAFLIMYDPLTASKLLVESLNAQWDSDLVILYSDCHTEDATAQIDQAERWLNIQPNDSGLLLALGKLCLHQKLWGKAQSYLDASISLHPSQAAYNSLGKLAEKLGKKDDAFNYYHLAMELETDK
jgi:HemY protein